MLRISALIGIFCAVFLTACGGGGGNGDSTPVTQTPSGGETNGNDQSTGMDPSLEPPIDPISQTPFDEIRLEANTLYLTDIHDISGADSNAPLSVDCEEDSCQIHTAAGAEVISLDDVDVFGGEDIIFRYEELGLYEGIPFIRSTTATQDLETTAYGYGGWLDYNAFFTTIGKTYIETRPSQGIIRTHKFAASIGQASETRPIDGSAYWEGAVAGVYSDLPIGVRGKASLTMDFTDAEMDVTFSRLRFGNILADPPKVVVFPILSQIEGEDLPAMRWRDLPVSADGRFGDATLQGSFYGPNHDEAGGVFDRDNLVGAFGTKRFLITEGDVIE